jgi:hypothetical protein
MVKHYHGDETGLLLLKSAVEAACAGMSVEAFGAEVLAWMSGASHPVLRRPYLSFAYTAGAEDALDRAKAHGWTVVSVKNDWATVFAGA